MLFKRKNNEIGTYIEIKVDRYKTNIFILDNSIKKVTDKLSFDYGFENVIDCAYDEARFFDKSMAKMDSYSFLSNYYNKVHPSIVNYISNIEFSILCKMSIPSKVNRVYISGDGASLFYNEFKMKFNNCYLKTT